MGLRRIALRTIPALTASDMSRCGLLSSHSLSFVRKWQLLLWLVVSRSCPYISNIFTCLQVEIMATNTQSTVKRAIRVLSKYYIDPINSSVGLLHLLSELIGKVDDQISRPLVVKYSQKTNAPLRTLKYNFDNSSRTEQKLKLGQSEW